MNELTQISGDIPMLTTDRLAQLREKAAQTRPPPIWVPTEPGEFVEGEILSSTRPMRGNEHCYMATENEITVMQPDGEPVRVQVYGWMGHDMAVADAGMGPAAAITQHAEINRRA